MSAFQDTPLNLQELIAKTYIAKQRQQRYLKIVSDGISSMFRVKMLTIQKINRIKLTLLKIITVRIKNYL